MREVQNDLYLETATEKYRSYRYEKNHSKADPDKSTQYFSLSSRMWWSTVSKADVRSNISRIEHFPASSTYYCFQTSFSSSKATTSVTKPRSIRLSTATESSYSFLHEHSHILDFWNIYFYLFINNPQQETMCRHKRFFILRETKRINLGTKFISKHSLCVETHC